MREEDLSYFENKEFKQILQTYEDALDKKQPIYMDADELTDIAEYYMVHNQEEMANDAITLALQLHPDSIDPQVFLSRQEMFHNNMKKAHEICDAIPDQEDREVVFLRAELEIREQRYKSAEIILVDALLKADDADHFLYDTVCIFIDYMLWPQAKRWCRKLLEDFPDYRGATELEAEILLCTGEYREAINRLNRILDENSYNTKAWDMLAEAQCASELYEEAIESCEFALAINERDHKALATIANSYYHLADYKTAHKYFQKALVESDDDVLYQMDAICLFQIGDFEKAASHLNVASSMIEQDSDRQLYIAMQQALVEGRLHHLDRALDALKRVKSLIREKSARQDYEVLYGQVMLENDLLSKARTHFKKAFEFSEDPEKTALVIGIPFYEKEYYAEALNMFSAVEMSPDRDTAHYVLPYMAMCHCHLNNTGKYLEYLRAAAHHYPELTSQVFEDFFPGIAPEEYYLYAYREAYGHFPKE